MQTAVLYDTQCSYQLPKCLLLLLLHIASRASEGCPPCATEEQVSLGLPKSSRVHMLLQDLAATAV
jgi:hypothetical protein